MSGKRTLSLHAFGFTCTQGVKRTRRAVTGIHSLPSDVLLLILRRIPERPRLLALSPVCKLWRTLILRTITSVSWNAQKSDEKLLNQLPSLTSLTLFNDHEVIADSLALRLPPMLTQLETASFGPLARLTAPRKLIYTGSCDLLDAPPSHLVSITELELCNAADWWSLAPQFRSLRTLVLNCADLSESMPRTFLVTHARHLQHLSLRNCSFIDRFLNGVFAPRLPALRTLHFEDSPDHDQFLARLVRSDSAPPLECVTISIRVPVTNGPLYSGIALRAANKSGALTLADCETLVLSSLLPISHIHLPCVTHMSLMLCDRPIALFDLVKRVSHFVLAAPQLRTLQLSLPNITEEQHLWELQDALQQAVQCGVQRLVAEFDGPVPTPLQAFFDRLIQYGWLRRATLRSRRINRAPLEESDEEAPLYIV